MAGPEAAAALAARHHALIAAARLGRDRGIGRVIDALACGHGAAIAPQLSGHGLARITEHVLDARVAIAERRRVLAALRPNPQPEVTALALAVLAGDDLGLRDQAVRILLARPHDAEVPRAAIEHALAEQMDRFERYARARPAYASTARESQLEVRYRGGGGALDAERFFHDELERCTERELGRLCELLAVLGDPGAMFDAERGLRAPTFLRRREAVDVLQEVVRGGQKARLLELLELYLAPPQGPRDAARARVIAIDPWLAWCADRHDDPAAHRLWALRAAPLFDALDGDSLRRLADHADEQLVPSRGVVVREGEPGDALYIVIDGVLAVDRAGTTVAELGPGEAFGELALLDGEPRQATVRARARSRLLRLPRATFDAALAAHPELGLGLVLGLAKWLRQGRAVPVSSLRQTML